MHTQTTILSLLAASTTALAAAVPSPAAQTCPDFYLVEKWGATFSQPRWNSSSFGTFKGCTSFKSKRDGDAQNPDTKVEVTDSHIVTAYSQSGEDPADQLWDRALEICGETFCDADNEIQVSSGRADDAEGTVLYLSLDGEYANTDLRDNFLSLLKDAFHKSIVQDVDDALGYVLSSNAAAVGNGVSTYDNALGGYMTYRFREGNPDSADCPMTVQTINSFGALVPDLAPVFGFATAVCNSV